MMPLGVMLLALGFISLIAFGILLYGDVKSRVVAAPKGVAITIEGSPCRVAGVRDDQIIMGTWFNASNEAMSSHILKLYVPAMTQYTCDNGVSYWREK